ncbi:MAG: glycosyltransferase family 4 protein [Desulfobacterales bacterium]|uniref:Glycosyltransferase family 4 protein n=1 Tax=Candidatus Desulfatibia vada TaxID=2841696 RepID=A0A8J6P3M4_9BACT|nr:glycosyltransferase family 4 protein [Candidatus Desulfatibia vada]
MNIAILTTEYVTEKDFHGGLANYLYRVTQNLVLSGHHVEVFTLSDQDNKIHHDGVVIHQVMNRSAFFTFLNRLTRYRFKRTFRFLSLSRCLEKRLKERRKDQPFDIVQASSCFACGFFSTFQSKLPVVSRVSSFEPLFRKFYRRTLSLDQRICEWLELYALKRSNAVYAPSIFLANILKIEEHIPTDVLRPPFSIETERFDESIYKKHLNGNKYFLFFGAIGFLKGCEVIANSLPEMLSRFLDIHFVFAGKSLEGPQGLTMMDYVYQQAESFKERVHYLGVLRHPQLYPIIKNSIAVVLPSLVDNFPNTMLEAMAFGKVVIGTKGTSFEEFIDDSVSGFLVEPGSAIELTTAMVKVCEMSEEERELIGYSAQEKIKHLNPEKACKNLLEYFQKIIDNN